MRLSEDEKRYIAQVLTKLAEKAISELGQRFQVVIKANYTAATPWLIIKVKPYTPADSNSVVRIN